MKILKHGNYAVAIKENGEIKLLYDNIPVKVSELENDVPYVTPEEVKEEINKIHIPVKVSELENDKKYTTEEYVNEKLNSIPKFSTQVVSSLPTEDIKNDVIYLVRSNNQQNEMYEEFIYVDGVWESLGKARIDLAPYVTEEELLEILKDFKPSGSGSETGSNSPVIYTLPLGEASWLRIAKVIDTSKIASGIFTFNSYGVKEDGSKDTLNAVTFSINSGIDRTKQVYGDVLPLSVSPEMSGSSSSGGSVDTPSSASIVEEDTPAVASEGDEILAISSEVPSSSTGPTGGSGGSASSSFGLNTVTIEEYEQEIYICGLISFPNVEYYKTFEVELILENNSNYEPLDTFEKVDFTMIDYKGQMPLLEGMEIKEYTNYEYIIKGKLTDYVEVAKNKKPLHIDIEYEGNEEQPDHLTLVKYTAETITVDFIYQQWGVTYEMTRDESSDRIIDGVQYYSYKSDRPISGSGVEELLVIDNPVTYDSTLYGPEGEIFEWDGRIEHIYDKNNPETKVSLVIKNKDTYFPSNQFGLAFVGEPDILYNNYYNIYTGDVFNIEQFHSNLIPFILECTNAPIMTVQSFGYDVYFRPSKKIKISISSLFGMEDYNLKLNDEIIDFSTPFILDLEEDKLSLECVGDSYGGIRIVVYIDNMEYEIRIPYEAEDNEVVKQYTIAENNPYNISLMIEELSKHNTIDKYNMHSIYKQIDNVEDEISYLNNAVSNLNYEIYDIRRELEETSGSGIITYTLSENFLTDTQRVILALNRMYLEDGTFSRENSYNFILIVNSWYGGRTPYIIFLNLYYGGEEIEFTPLFGENLGKKYVLNENQIYFDNYLYPSDINDDMFTISGSEIGGGVTEEYVNQAIANAITDVLETEF